MLIWCEFLFLRPGFGGSTLVPLSQRISVWIEAVPLVLARLGVKHVALFSHSAGTIYSLNTLGQLREILDPVKPYVAFIGKIFPAHHRGNALYAQKLAMEVQLHGRAANHHASQHRIFTMTIRRRS
jgi:pimeloyl-ACP methyl ester carboxylesterase